MKKRFVSLNANFFSTYAEIQAHIAVDTINVIRWQITYELSTRGESPITSYNCILPETIARTEMDRAQTFELVYYARWNQTKVEIGSTKFKIYGFQEHDYGNYAKVLVRLGHNIILYGYLPKELIVEINTEREVRDES